MPLDERLISITLSLEEALMREAWDESDALFEARAELIESIPPHMVPREVDEIDARILNNLQKAQAEVRRETLALTTTRRAVAAYGVAPLPARRQAA